MPRTRATVAVFAALLAGLALSGCSLVGVFEPEPPIDIGPREDNPWRRMTDARLQAKIAEADGWVHIGFKDPWESAGIIENIVVVSPEAAAGGKALLSALGVEIRHDFGPAVHGRMSPALLPFIRADSRIEYVEPAFPLWPYRAGFF